MYSGSTEMKCLDIIILLCKNMQFTNPGYLFFVDFMEILPYPMNISSTVNHQVSSRFISKYLVKLQTQVPTPSHIYRKVRKPCNLTSTKMYNFTVILLLTTHYLLRVVKLISTINHTQHKIRNNQWHFKQELSETFPFGGPHLLISVSL